TLGEYTASGDYFVVVSNSLLTVTSTVAKVTVLPDTVGPRIIDATGNTNTYASRGGAQTIAIAFNEDLGQSATNAINFTVFAGSNYATKVTFTNVTALKTDRPRIYLWMTGPNWVLNKDYWVLINGVQDRLGNTIAPNSKV